VDVSGQETRKSAGTHGLDVDCPAGQQDGHLLAHGNGVAGPGELEMLLQSERQVIGLIEPPGMQWQSLIFHTGGRDLGPKLLVIVGRGLRRKAHLDSCWPLIK
jgi:hypothetical protein